MPHYILICPSCGHENYRNYNSLPESFSCEECCEAWYTDEYRELDEEMGKKLAKTIRSRKLKENGKMSDDTNKKNKLRFKLALKQAKALTFPIIPKSIKSDTKRREL